MTESKPTTPPTQDAAPKVHAEPETRGGNLPLTAAVRKDLYESARFLDLDTRRSLDLDVSCTVYIQDPSTQVTENTTEEIHVRWEPGLADGPTSARLAVVDYDPDTQTLYPPARWDAKERTFLEPSGRRVADAPDTPQFRQVHAWAQVQRVLEYYEDPRALGRPIPWASDANRLMIAPHAGYRQNACYDRRSKSLQLSYYGDPALPRYTCLSHDILAHETGHAVLDGIRPHYLENTSWETAAFHEFIGDLTAILSALRNNKFRNAVTKNVGTAIDRADILANIAEEFGTYVQHRPFLRTARSKLTYQQASELRTAHECSAVLTGAMFDILVAIAGQYLSEERQAARKEAATPANALWWAAERIQRTALQPLDLLPPADIRFSDYATAVLRHDEIVDPLDEHHYRDLMRRVFHERGLCSLENCQETSTCALTPSKVPTLEIFHDPSEVARSRTEAYHYLHDNRRALGIPPNQDFAIIELYGATKRGHATTRLPRHLIVQYLWREAVPLDDERFQSLQGTTTHLLCGGTLVLDDRGNILCWTPKHGRGTPEGDQRHADLREHIACLVERRHLTLADDPSLLAGYTPPVLATQTGTTLHLHTQLHLCGTTDDEHEPWTSSF